MSDFNPNSPDAQFATIIAKMDAQSAASAEHHTEIVRLVTDHEKRIGKLEGDKLKQRGFMAGIAAASGSAGHLITKFLTGNGGSPPAHH